MSAAAFSWTLLNAVHSSSIGPHFKKGNITYDNEHGGPFQAAWIVELAFGKALCTRCKRLLGSQFAPEWRWQRRKVRFSLPQDCPPLLTLTPKRYVIFLS